MDASNGGRWYFSRKEIEENSRSRNDGIDLKKETYLRKSYCTFLQDLGVRLKVPQVTIATAIVFCQRFFLRQSHAKNDRRTIATVCMFLAGKVEETPRPLKDVILVSYEIIHKKDPAAAQRIKQKEVYEQHKELILLGERVVLATLGFDLNIQHPYKPLVEAIKTFNVGQNALAKVAWNFVNDGLRTSLCLQFKPHQIAAGAIFLAAKFLKVKLPSDGEKVWWQEFDVTPRQLEEVSNQMLELYEQNRAPSTQGSEVEGSVASTAVHWEKSSTVTEEQVLCNGHAQTLRGPGAASTLKTEASKQSSSQSLPEHAHIENKSMPLSSMPNQIDDSGSTEMGSVITDHRKDTLTKDREQSSQSLSEGNKYEFERTEARCQSRDGLRKEAPCMLDGASRQFRNLGFQEDTLAQSPRDAIKMIDKQKVKAALEKRKRSRGDLPQKKDLMDDDDLIERALEDGVEMAVQDQRIRQERRHSHTRTENSRYNEDRGDIRHAVGKKEKSSVGAEAEGAEEGEMLDDVSLTLNTCKRKGSQLDGQSERNQRPDCASLPSK